MAGYSADVGGSNGGMQPTYRPVELEMQKSMNSATGPGGNNTLINQDEAKVLSETIEYAPLRAIDNTWNSVEDDSHVTPIYGEHNFAGS